MDLMREFSDRYLWYCAMTSFASLSVASLHWISRFSFPARLSTIRRSSTSNLNSPGLLFALITNVLKTRSEIDTTGGTPIMLYNALELYFSLIVSGLYNSNIIEKCQDAPNGYHDQKDSDPERLSHLCLLIRSDQNQIVLAVYLSGLILLAIWQSLAPRLWSKKLL